MQEAAAAVADDEKAVHGEPASPKPLDAASISAEARSAGVRTPKLPEIQVEDEAAARSEKAGGLSVKPPPASADPPKKKSQEEDEFEALAKRFEALKKR